MAHRPFIPKMARRVIEAALDQRHPSKELKAAVQALLTATEDPDRQRI